MPYNLEKLKKFSHIKLMNFHMKNDIFCNDYSIQF